VKKTKGPFILIVIFFLIILSPQITSYSYAQNDNEHAEDEHVLDENGDSELKIFISVEKIILTKSIGVLGPGESNVFEFNLKNFNDDDITGIELLLSDFTIEEETIFSNSPLFINQQDITIEPSGTLNLGENEKQQIKLSISDQVKKEGTYKGKLTVTGDDVKPTTINVTLKVHENISELVVFTIMGAIISGTFGLLLTYLEKKEEFKSSTEDDTAIISHINGHIREINKNCSHIQEKFWQYLSDTLPLKKTAIEKYRNKLELDPNAEAIEWFEKVTWMIPEMYLDNATHANRALFEEIVKPEKLSVEEKDKLAQHKSEKWREKVRQDTFKLKKWFYFGSTLLVALPTTMFTTDKFVQDPFLDVVIAFAIGFAIYRVQDIQKAFTKEVKKTPKVEDKNSKPGAQIPHIPHDNDGNNH